MKKIAIVIIVLFVLSLTFFFIRAFMAPKEQMGEVIDLSSEYVFEDPENYEIEKKNGVNLVKNENLAFSFEIPGNWTAEEYRETPGEYDIPVATEGLIFFSPEHAYNEYGSTIKGCNVLIYAYYEEYLLDHLKREINFILEEKVERDEVTLVEIDNYYGHGLALNIDPLRGKAVTEIPFKNKIYVVEINLSQSESTESVSEREMCTEVYYNLLDSISFSEKDEE